jgi:hypothetical protein
MSALPELLFIRSLLPSLPPAERSWNVGWSAGAPIGAGGNTCPYSDIKGMSQRGRLYALRAILAID